jgi:hypothetical protein
MSIVQDYQEYMSTIGDRLEVYRLIAKQYHINSALYPGCHIDVTPSFVIPDVTYVDSFKGTIKFFNKMDSVQALLDKNKEYSQNAHFTFYGQDYHQPIKTKKVDLILSLFAGFVGQATKQYLKPQGILLANDSHGDASLAYLDADFVFIGVIENNRFTSQSLEQYFSFKRKRPIDTEKILRTMKGPTYSIQPDLYVFQYHPKER